MGDAADDDAERRAQAELEEGDGRPPPEDEETPEVVEAEVVEDEEPGTSEEAVREAEERALVLRQAAPPATSLIPSAAEFTAMQEIAKRIASTQMVPTAYRGKPDDVIAAILTGREMNMGPMQSLREIHIIEGKPTLSANLLLGRMREGGIVILESVSTAERAWIRAQRRDTGEIAEVEWTFEEASKITTKGKKLVEKDNWRNYPADMLWARCVGRLARRLGSDLIGSAMPYSSEEVQDWDDADVGSSRYPTHRSGGPRTWGEITERLGVLLGKEEGVAWVTEIRDNLYAVAKVSDLPTEGQQHFFSRLVAVVDALEGEGEVQFRPDVRAYVADVFEKHFAYRPEGPPWSLAPDEAETRPAKETSGEQGEAAATGDGEKIVDGEFIDAEDIPFGAEHEGYGS